ncbi:glucose-6-phosphate isomerase [Kytococcus aerolatus]|uniref:Glucose-6-phosphate isomerase n=1 Tax=Kytococcus aerolatus TaxID=592308 RepID=A0A212T0W7_9MICO|nr:glucose-6-phosphate isomerase [Kytococcus aerolatus]SNC59520.1 glucose-6-phosphate isomerase [Kytococcus aerolatus]
MLERSSEIVVEATGPAATAITEHVPGLVERRVASRLAAKDATLWGEAAREEAAQRLGWVDLHRTSRALIGEVETLAARYAERGCDRVVLCGMGGSSLAPEVITRTAGVELVVCDSSDPAMVTTALGTPEDLRRTVVVVSSKSGSTAETDSQRRTFVDALTRADLEPTEHMVIVTDPGSPFDQSARAEGFDVVNADPSVGGRYSALTAFGLVPCALAGVDVAELLDEADAVADLLAADDEANPALRLAAVMAGASGGTPRDVLVISRAGSALEGLGDWAEQLIAESTGKDGKGVLPVVDLPSEVGAEPLAHRLADQPDVTVVRLIGDEVDERDDELAGPDGEPVDNEHPAAVVNVGGALGGQLLLWETATAVAGELLGLNPFDQPDVESAKTAAREQMTGGDGAPPEPTLTVGEVEVYQAGTDFLGDAGSLTEAVEALLAQVGPSGYLAVMAYTDRWAHASEARAVQERLTAATGRPVTFGWGPRFLHSTGQFHKGGPADGVFLQITRPASPEEDRPVPGQEFTFGRLIAAQAAGDAQVLAEQGRPVLRLVARSSGGHAAVVDAVLAAGQAG